MWSKFVQEERWAISCATLSPGSWSSMGTPHCGQGHVHASKWPVVRWWWSVAVSLSASAGLLLQPERGHEGSSSRRGRNTNRRILQPHLFLLPSLSLEPSARQILLMTFYLWSWGFNEHVSKYGLWSDQWESRGASESADWKTWGFGCRTLWEHKV